MWKRFTERLRCPISGGPLRLTSFREREVVLEARHVDAAGRSGFVVDSSFSSFVETGVLLSEAGWMYPVMDGVPVLLPYRTAIHEQFQRDTHAELTRIGAYSFPDQTP